MAKAKKTSKAVKAVKPERRAKRAKPATVAPKVAAVEVAPEVAAEAAAPEIVTEALAPVSNEIEEGTETMKTATQPVADRFQAIFGDVNERARQAFEKNAKMVEEFTDLTRGNVEALVASSKVAARGVEALSQEAADYSRKSFEDASSALRTFAEVKSPTELFRLQSEFAKSQFDSMVAESSKVSEAMLKLAGEMFEPLSSRYSVAAEKVKAVVAA